MDPIVPLKLPASAAKDASEASPSATRQVLEETLRYFSSSPGQAPAWTQAELRALRKESDEELLAAGLLHVAGRLKGQNQPEAAAYLLARLSDSSMLPDTQAKALAELKAIQGGGAFGQRAEFLIGRFAKDATDARMIVPMIGAGFLGQAAGSVTLGRLLVPTARGSQGLWNSAWMARLGGASTGYLAEVSAFTVLGRAMSPQATGPWSEDLARGALTVGALKFAGLGGRSLGQQVSRTPLGSVSQISQVLLPQGAALTGLMAAHGLEERVGLRPHVEGRSLFFESLASLISLNVGARLGHQALGRGFQQAQSQLAFRARQLSVAPRFSQPFQPFQPAFAAATGNRSGFSAPAETPFGKTYMMASNMGSDGFGGGNGQGGGKKTGTFGSDKMDAAPGRPRQASGAVSSNAPIPGRPETLDPADVIAMDSISPERTSSLPPTVEVSDPYVGQIVDGRYRIEGVLGEGGMGIVYRGQQEMLLKAVAIKILKPEVSQNPEMVHRFLNEARAATAIGNPHIIEVSDFGKLPDGSAYFVMEFLKGKELYSLVEQGHPVPTGRLIHIARQLAEGLGAAHQAGIVHRDLKPENVFLIRHGKTEDFVKILDFGIAKVQGNPQNTRLTQDGAIFGTPAYMSPEQVSSNPIDRRSDIYSYGVMLYELATARLPFEAPSVPNLYTLHLYKAPQPPRERVSDPEQIPPGLEAIILKCMNKDPKDRYQTMEEVVADLDRLQQGLTPAAAAADSGQRSTELSVPDYFQSGVGPRRITPDKGGTRSEETLFIPRSKPRWPLVAGLSGVGVLGLVTAAALLSASRSDGDAADPDVPQAEIPPSQARPTPQVEPIEPDAQPTPDKISVLFSVEPADAEIFQEDQKLEKSPVLIQLEKGSQVDLVVRREGYKTKDITIDGSQEKLNVKLEKDPKAAPPRPKSSGNGTKTPKPKGSSEEIFNPWK